MIKEIALEEAIRRHLAGECFQLIIVSDEQETKPEKAKEKPEKPKKIKKAAEEEKTTVQIDWGRVWALRKAEWTWGKIAEDIGVPYYTIYNAKDSEASKKARNAVYVDEEVEEDA